MTTSSITKCFIINEPEQVERFANAVEESYQDSLSRKTNPSVWHENSNKKDLQRIISIWSNRKR